MSKPWYKGCPNKATYTKYFEQMWIFVMSMSQLTILNHRARAFLFKQWHFQIWLTFSPNHNCPIPSIMMIIRKQGNILIRTTTTYIIYLCYASKSMQGFFSFYKWASKKSQTKKSFIELELEDMKAFNLTTFINTTECGMLGRLSSCPSFHFLVYWWL